MQKPSRSELQVILGRLQTKIGYVTDEIAFLQTKNPKLDGYFSDLENRKKANTASLKGTVNSYIAKKLECSAQISNATTTRDSCADASTLSRNLDRAVQKDADSVANVGEYKWGNAAKTTYIRKLKGKLNELKRQREVVYGSLGAVDPLVGSARKSDPAAINAILNSKKEDNWLKFEFNSENHQSYDTVKFSSKEVGVKVGVWTPLFGLQGRAKISEEFSETDRAMSQASLKVKGKLLRVRIKRPWFKPELFDDRNFDFVSHFVSSS